MEQSDSSAEVGFIVSQPDVPTAIIPTLASSSDADPDPPLLLHVVVLLVPKNSVGVVGGISGNALMPRQGPSPHSPIESTRSRSSTSDRTGITIRQEAQTEVPGEDYERARSYRHLLDGLLATVSTRPELDLQRNQAMNGDKNSGMSDGRGLEKSSSHKLGESSWVCRPCVARVRLAFEAINEEVVEAPPPSPLPPTTVDYNRFASRIQRVCRRRMLYRNTAIKILQNFRKRYSIICKWKCYVLEIQRRANYACVFMQRLIRGWLARLLIRNNIRRTVLRDMKLKTLGMIDKMLSERIFTLPNICDKIDNSNSKVVNGNVPSTHWGANALNIIDSLPPPPHTLALVRQNTSFSITSKESKLFPSIMKCNSGLGDLSFHQKVEDSNDAACLHFHEPPLFRSIINRVNL